MLKKCYLRYHSGWNKNNLDLNLTNGDSLALICEKSKLQGFEKLSFDSDVKKC